MKEALTERMRHAAAHVELYDQEWEAQQLRDGAAEIDRLRYHLTELGKFADRAGLVLATLEAENSDEEEQIQQIIDGISTWAAPAILGEVMGPNAELRGRPLADGPA